MDLSNKLISFEYITVDERLLRQPKELRIDPSKATIVGELCKGIYNPVKVCSQWMYGFFIIVDGVEYGSLTTTQAQFQAYQNQRRCKPRRIHVRQFVRQFR